MATDTRADVLAELRTQTALLRQILVALKPAAESANDSLLSGPKGDPIIKAKDPRDWSGESMMGRQMSECPPEYLDLLAQRLDYFAAQKDASDPEQAKKQKYEMLDANRARAWAARLRAGWKPPALPPQRVNEADGEPRW